MEYGGFAVGSIEKAFRETAARAGFAPGEVTPYTLRHTAATWMAQDGVPLWEIAGHLGHQDTRMVEKHYAHHHPDFRKRAKRSLGRRLARLSFDPDRLRPARPGLRNAGVAPQLHPSSGEGAKPTRRKSLKKLVGAGGIEPPTPTMST